MTLLSCKNLPLNARVALITLAIVVCSIWVISVHRANGLREDMKPILFAQQYARVKYIANSIDESLRIRIETLTMVANELSPKLISTPASMRNYLEQHKALGKLFSLGLYAISSDGKGIADYPLMDGRAAADYTKREYFQQVMATGKPVIGKPVIGRFAKEPVLLIAVPIKNNHDQVIGVLVGANLIHGSDLFNEVQTANISSHGDIFIISPKDRIFVASTDPKRVLAPIASPGINTMLDRYIGGFDGSGIMLSSNEIEALSSGCHIPTTGWIVDAFLPTAVAFAPIKARQNDIYLDAALASIAAALLIGIFLRRQLLPLNRAAHELQKMTGDGAHFLPLPIDGAPEFRRLFKSFNQLQMDLAKKGAALQQTVQALQENNLHLEQEISDRKKIEVSLHEQAMLLESEIANRQVIQENLTHQNSLLEQEMATRQLAEEALQKLNEELEQRVQLRTKALEAVNAELEAFSYSVSHDLRAPLRHINSYSALLREDFAANLPEAGQEFLTRISKASSRMGSLIDDLLQLSRVSRAGIRYEQINVTTIAGDIVRMLQDTDNDRQVEVVIAEEMRTYGDAALLHTALQNLISNAWKYSSKQASARIEIGEIHLNGAEAFFIKDNGAGFDMAYANKLFGAFQRLHGAEYEGTGIGLATVQRIIHRHGGKIWAEAKENEGATFYFTLQSDFDVSA